VPLPEVAAVRDRDEPIPPPTSTHNRRRRAPGAAAAAEQQPWRGARAPRARRARQLVGAVGVAGVLVAGGTFVFGDAAAWFDPDHVPRVVAAADWESQARVALTSINRQLDSISATEAVWDQIAPLYAGTPEQVQALRARKTLLEQQRAALQSQLATADQLTQARAVLADLDQQLAQLAATLGDLPPGGRLSPDQLYVRDTLTARRDLLLQERSARQADVDRLEQGLAAAQRGPVPDPTDQTTPLTLQVLGLRDHPPAPPAPQQPAPPVTNSVDRRDSAILASDLPPSARKAEASARSNIGSASAVTDTVTKPVREVAEQVPLPIGNDTLSGSTGASNSGRSAARKSPPPAQEDVSFSSTSSNEPESSTSDSPPLSRSSSGSAGSATTYYGYDMTPQQAWDIAMSTPQGRMAADIAGASGAPVG